MNVASALMLSNDLAVNLLVPFISSVEVKLIIILLLQICLITSLAGVHSIHQIKNALYK